MLTWVEWNLGGIRTLSRMSGRRWCPAQRIERFGVRFVEPVSLLQLGKQLQLRRWYWIVVILMKVRWRGAAIQPHGSWSGRHRRVVAPIGLNYKAAQRTTTEKKIKIYRVVIYIDFKYIIIISNLSELPYSCTTVFHIAK